MTRMAAALAALAFALMPAAAVDRGQYEHVPQAIRDWFKSVKSPSGVPCCDISDGHVTTWRATAGGLYEVPIEGTWTAVPPDAVIHDAGNPVGEAVVWYTRYDGKIFIRCFVPASGV